MHVIFGIGIGRRRGRIRGVERISTHTVDVVRIIFMVMSTIISAETLFLQNRTHLRRHARHETSVDGRRTVPMRADVRRGRAGGRVSGEDEIGESPVVRGRRTVYVLSSKLRRMVIGYKIRYAEISLR